MGKRVTVDVLLFDKTVICHGIAIDDIHLLILQAFLSLIFILTLHFLIKEIKSQELISKIKSKSQSQSQLSTEHIF